MPARRKNPRSGSPVLADLSASRGGAAQALRHRAWTPDDASGDEPSGEREARPARRSSSSFTAPFRESFFDLAQRYHRLREAAFHKSKPATERKARGDLTPPPIPLVRERRLTDLAPPRDEQESVTEALYADRFVEEAAEEATLVQPLARRPSEAPPSPASERPGYATMRPPPPPEPLPRLLPNMLPSAMLPSTMPPPPVALATVPPSLPPASPQSFWRPMLATAALSATIGAIVSVGMWAVRSPAEASKPSAAATLEPTKVEPATVSTIGPCPVPSTPSNTTSSTSASLSTTALSQGPAPHEVSLEALPVETRSPRAVANAAPVLRAPAAPPPRAARAVVAERAVATRAAAAEPARPARAESEHSSRHGHKSVEAVAAPAAADNDDEAETPTPAAAPSPPPAPTAGPDRAAIARAVGRAASAASTCDASPQSGRAQITFAPSGNVASVQLIQPFSDNSVNGCVLRALGRAHVPPFAGEPVIVRKALSW